MRMKRISGDHAGIEGLPLRLLIVSLLISLTLPLFVGAYQCHSSDLMRAAAKADMDKVESASLSTFLGGVGSVRVIELDSDRTGRRFMEIGGTPGSAEFHSLRYTGGGVEITRFLDDLPVGISSPSGRSVMIGPTAQSLRFECGMHNSTLYIMVEVIE